MRSINNAVIRLEKRAKKLKAPQFCQCSLNHIDIDQYGIARQFGELYAGELYQPGKICKKCGKPYPDNVYLSFVHDVRAVIYVLKRQGEAIPEYYKVTPEGLERCKNNGWRVSPEPLALYRAIDREIQQRANNAKY